jgi:hypothetical protein
MKNHDKTQIKVNLTCGLSIPGKAQVAPCCSYISKHSIPQNVEKILDYLRNDQLLIRNPLYAIICI